MSSIKTGMIFLLALLGFGATGLAQTSTTNGGGSGGSGPPDLTVNITGAPNGDVIIGNEHVFNYTVAGGKANYTASWEVHCGAGGPIVPVFVGTKLDWKR